MTLGISKRRLIGILCIAVSAFALIVYLAYDAADGQWNYVGKGSSDGDYWMLLSSKGGVSEYYLIPIALLGIIGAVFLLWPSRRPSKLQP